MSSLREKLLAQLSRFDEESFIALANRGLLRRARKELEKHAAVLLEESAEALVVGIGEHRVRFDAGGPAHARCSCPAAGVCQHVLAAAVGLQAQAETADPEAQDGGAAVPDSSTHQTDPLAALRGELLAFSSAALVRHCGKAGYRWAWQYVEDLDAEQEVSLGGDLQVTITLPHPRVTFRYMGGGIGSLIADAPLKQMEKYQAAAVLAFQRVHGIAPAPPEAAKPRPSALALGKDHEKAAPASEAQRDSRSRLRERTVQLLAECVTLGLSHLSQAIHDRFATLATWSQGAEYPRLALMLRRLADHVALLLERAGGADEHRLFDELTLAFGLVTALEESARLDRAPAALVGRARSRYEQTGTVELLGLGASAWRAASGYVGLTLIFWSPTLQGFLSCTDARPEGQRGFDPIARYKAAGPWSGLGAPAQATGRRVLLTHAQMNELGRLSAAESSVATVQGELTAEELVGRLQPQTRWAGVAETRTRQNRSLLAQPRPMADWVALQPRRFGPAHFDAARQTLLWPLHDEADDCLMAELPYSDYTRHAIGRVEQLTGSEVAPGAVLIARLQDSAKGLAAEPLSLLRPHPALGRNPVDALHFDEPERRGVVSRWLSGLKRNPAHPAAESMVPAAQPVLPAALRSLRQWLQRTAERGVAGDSAGMAMTDLRTRVEQAEGAGFTAFGHLHGGDTPAPVHILRTHYLCLQYERLFQYRPIATSHHSES